MTHTRCPCCGQIVHGLPDRAARKHAADLKTSALTTKGSKP